MKIGDIVYSNFKSDLGKTPVVPDDELGTVIEITKLYVVVKLYEKYGDKLWVPHERIYVKARR